MSFVSREFLNTTPTAVFGSFIQAIKDSGWEEVYSASSTNYVLRTNGEDGLGPYVYINILLSSGIIYYRGYQYWENTTGYCPFPSTQQTFMGSGETILRVYCNKSFIVTGSGFSYFFISRSPLRFIRTAQTAITGATSVTITLDSISNFRIGNKYNVFGVKGEGQQEIQVTARDTVNKTITVTGCTNNYSIGALVGDYILTCVTASSSYDVDAFAYNRIGTTAIPTSTNVYFAGKNGAEGAPYSHDSSYTLESMILKSANRYLGDISPLYVKYGKGLAVGDVCFVLNSDEPIVDSVPTSFTEYTLVDNTANWDVDSLIGKCVLFISGTGSGYSRYIIGNTANTLTFRTILPTITTSTGYRIVDAVYRVQSFDYTALLKEEF